MLKKSSLILIFSKIKNSKYQPYYVPTGYSQHKVSKQFSDVAKISREIARQPKINPIYPRRGVVLANSKFKLKLFLKDLGHEPETL